MSLPQSITRHKYQSGQGLVEYALIIILFIIIVVIIAAILYLNVIGKEFTCEDYANFTINSIPVRCWKYFGITGAPR